MRNLLELNMLQKEKVNSLNIIDVSEDWCSVSAVMMRMLIRMVIKKR